MADYVDLDVSEVLALASDLSQAGPAFERRAEQAVEVTSRRIKDDARALISGLRHAPLYPDSITYDVTTGPGWIEGEIGPDKQLPQGPLGNLLEFGSVNNSPNPHLSPALTMNLSDLLTGLGRAAVDAVEDSR